MGFMFAQEEETLGTTHSRILTPQCHGQQANTVQVLCKKQEGSARFGRCFFTLTGP